MFDQLSGSLNFFISGMSVSKNNQLMSSEMKLNDLENIKEFIKEKKTIVLVK